MNAGAVAPERRKSGFAGGLGNQFLVLSAATVARFEANDSQGKLVAQLAGGDILVTLGVMQQQRCTADLQRMIDLR